MVKKLEHNNCWENNFRVLWVVDEEFKGFIKCCPRRDGIFLVFLSRRPDIIELKEFSAYRLDWKRKTLLMAKPGNTKSWAGKKLIAGQVHKEASLKGLVNELEIIRFSKPYSWEKHNQISRWALVVTNNTCQCCGRPILSPRTNLLGEDTVCELCLYGLAYEDDDMTNGY